jgi:hypothetical protein
MMFNNSANNFDMGSLAQQMVNDLINGRKNVNDYLAPLQIAQP